MAKKMYYSDEEAAAKLGVSVEDLTNLIRQRKLREFRDGARRMFKADEVDALASAASQETGEIKLSPSDTTADVVKLSEAEPLKAPGKEDTVITAEGISIFDEEDLEIETADPMAKTQIAPSLDDQVSIEGVGSGSGLLDLTRESDDTSLGEVLDHIDIPESAAEEPVAAASATFAPVGEPPMLAEPMAAVETVDASSGLFGGLLVGAAIVAVLLGAVMLAAMNNVLPGYLEWMQGNLSATLVILVVVLLACGVVGFMVGKSSAAKQMA